MRLSPLQAFTRVECRLTNGHFKYLIPLASLRGWISRKLEYLSNFGGAIFKTYQNLGTIFKPFQKTDLELKNRSQTVMRVKFEAVTLKAFQKPGTIFKLFQRAGRQLKNCSQTLMPAKF